MIINIEPLNQLNFKEFSSELEHFKQEILSEGPEVEGEDAVVLEIIKVLQEEIAKRKSKKKDLSDDVKLLAYLSLFNSIMEGSFDEDVEEEDISEFLEFEDFEDDSEQEE